MYNLVNVGQHIMAAHLTTSDREGCSEVLYIQCSGWWLMMTVVEQLWNGNKEEGNVLSEREEGEDTDCEGGDSDTDW